MKKTVMAAAAVLVVAGCSGVRPALSEENLGGVWRVTEIAGEKPLSDRGEISFDKTNNRVAAYFGCNRMMGSYQQAGGKLKFSQMASTMMACLGNHDDDAKGGAALDRVRSWRYDYAESGTGHLVLNDVNGTAVMKLQLQKR